eukprot:9792007-Ditylum_brightwellii.AAC.1
MMTAGYWQLCANHGVWTLEIAKNLCGTDIFHMVDGTIQDGRIKMTGKSTTSTKSTDDKIQSSGDKAIHVFLLATDHLEEWIASAEDSEPADLQEKYSHDIYTASSTTISDGKLQFEKTQT